MGKNNLIVYQMLYPILFPSYFSTIEYSADGECILAAGKSANICIYNVREAILLKKFEITQNHSLDGLNVSINLGHREP